MKPPVLFKKADLIIQVLVILGALYYAFTAHSFDFVWSYIAVGTVQVLSALLNRLLLPANCRAGSRIGYEIALLIIGIFGLITLFHDRDSMVFMVALMYGSPVLAIWYVGITIAELGNVNRANAAYVAAENAAIRNVDTDIT